jgi:hypothetical protein
VDTLVIASGEIARTGAFDLDDACAEVSELARSERRCDRVLQRNDREAFKWLHVLLYRVG